MRNLNLSAEDRLAAGVFVVYLLFVVWMAITEDRSRSSTPSVEQTPTTEGRFADRREMLDRLENGETVRVDRWHGHTLELEGSLIVDTDALDREEEEDTDG